MSPTTPPPDSQLVWLQAAYQCFAAEGPAGLKVERLAKLAAKSKSSFYHHFVDTEVFLEALLDYHLVQARRIAIEAAACQRMVPDVVEMLLRARTDILFNRQLRVHRSVEAFRRCFQTAHEPIEEGFLAVWAQALGLAERPALARMMLNLTVENFYLRITPENLCQEWLLEYLGEIQVMVRGLTGGNG
ncbi:TetR/AcrR family transcriptional regulator [Eisenibacter elegans]|uniref:TetR/AcrR family transcriptional regulator n=1 Tax=Eisenibacter elegans TaxID=997 RepID=UPI000422C8DF|nr:TetR/AcrR family transcriptional regulator [Eisenibacter elegans]